MPPGWSSGEKANAKPIEDRTNAKEDGSWTVHNIEGHIIVETINITSLRTNAHTTMERKAHFTAFQEHVMEAQETHIFKGIMGKRALAC